MSRPARHRQRPGTAPVPAEAEMVWIAGGRFRMGSDHHYAEEKPAHWVKVDGFFIDATPVTNAQFRDYCRRYRPAARHAEPIDTLTSHVGFRCVRGVSAQELPS